jgi:hypothetical protein
MALLPTHAFIAWTGKLTCTRKTIAKISYFIGETEKKISL